MSEPQAESSSSAFVAALEFSECSSRHVEQLSRAMPRHSLRHVTRHSIVNMVGGIVSQGLKLGVLIYIARRFSTADFGLFSFCWALYAFMLVLSNFGLPVFGSRQVAKTGLVNHRLLETIGLSRASLALVSTIAAALLLSFIPKVRGTEVLLVILLGLSNLTSAFLFDWAFQGLGRLDASATLNMFLQALWLVLTCIVVHFGAGIAAVGFTLCLATAITSCVGYFWLRGSSQLQMQGTNLSEMWSDSWKVLSSSRALGIGTILITVLIWTDVVVVRLLRGEEAAGIYSAGNKAALGLAMLATFFVQGAFPLLSKASASGRGLFEECLQRTYEHLATMFLPGVIWSLAYAAPIIGLVFGRADYLAGTHVFQIFQIILLLFAANALFGTGVVVAFHRDRTFQKTLYTSALVLLAVCPILTWLFGIVGTATAVLVSQLVSLIGFCSASRELARPKHGQALLPPLIAGFLVVSLDSIFHLPLLWSLTPLALVYVVLIGRQWRQLQANRV
jgi:O-antigen/teichoic acid export membrane protein